MTTAGTIRIEDDPGEPVITDVWSRTTTKYRARAIVLLIVNILLFGCLTCFAYWVREGRLLAPATESYWQQIVATFTTIGGDATLANFVLFPIRLDLVPWHGVVVGLMLAALVSIPILISILYRFPACLPFILLVAFLAVMPWLAVTLTGACILASVKPFRFRFRYASALLGLVLVIFYFYGASRQTAAPFAQFPPEDRIVFMFPWVLATIASCAIMGGVLALARLVNYRPGVVAPSLLVSFIIPMVLFARHVGPDELYYRLLEEHVRKAFLPRDVTALFEHAVHDEWSRRPAPRPAGSAVRATLDFRLASALDDNVDPRNIFAEQRIALIAECDRFLRAYPHSRYAANVLYLKARTMDMRVDEAALLEAKKMLRFYDDFPAATSEMTWRKVVYNDSESDKSAVARLMLARIYARQGRMDEALQLLEELVNTFDARESGNKDRSVKKVLESKPPDDSLKIPVDRVLLQARQLQALLRENIHDPRYGLRPFCGSKPGERSQNGLLQLDPRHPLYRTNLLRLISDQGYPDCLLADNICLLAALQVVDAKQRIQALEDCLKRYPSGDARPESLYRLGVAYHEAQQAARARRTLEAMLAEFPDDPLWSAPARDRLRVVSAAPVETPP